MKISMLTSSFFGTLWLSAVVAAAAPATNFDADAVSDQPYVTIAPADGALSWAAALTTTSAPVALGTLGTVGDHLIPAVWEGGSATQIGVLQSDGANSVTWKIIKSDASTSSVVQGQPTDTFLSGGDFDNSGAADIASVRKVKSKLRWTVQTNPFVSGVAPVTSSFNFGASTGVPFYFNFAGSGDGAAVISELKVAGKTRTWLQVRHLAGGTTRKFLLSSFAKSAGRPLPIRLSSGGDGLVFLSQGASATRVLVMSARGRRILKATVNLTGTILVGDFIAGGGEELLINGGEGTGVVLSLDNTQSMVGTPTGIPVDEINTNSFSGGSNPAPGQCSAANPTDGGGGFVWKPRSDTQVFAVAVLPGRFTGSLSSVQLETSAGVLIESLRYKGTGNPDTGGPRSSWISNSMTGQDLKNTYGSVVVKVNFSNSSCLRYALANPARRYD